MALSIGIVGLPNVGKSTLFNALTRAQNAQAANYPFCTIEPNKAIVAVPDERLKALSAIVNPQKVQQAIVEFYDIAGLVKGASKGEGLGNQFLGHIRETSAIIHVVRCFEDENVVHVDGSVQPIRDIEVINTELILADMQSLEKGIVRLEKGAKTDKKLAAVAAKAKELLAFLNEGKPAIVFPEKDELYDEVRKEFGLITMKPVIYAANVDEDSLATGNAYVDQVREYAKGHDSLTVQMCAKIEEEMGGMSDEERNEFLASLGVTDGGGLEHVIKAGYDILGLVSYFTAGVKEVRAWTIQRGWKAPKAASVIHNDFERGFIRAEVISYDDFIACKGEAGARAAGKLRVEGKDYVVADGDVLHFRFAT